MRIDPSTCNGCRLCLPYCPVSAIVATADGACRIDQEECVECGVCRRSAPCPNDSFRLTESPWPRSVRPLFSDPRLEHCDTRVPGRGTEEMKTNDVTGRFKVGQIGLVVEVGRPGVGARLRDVETVTAELAGIGAKLEPHNPLASLVVDRDRGLLHPDVLSEKVLSVVIECAVAESDLGVALAALEKVATRIETVFTIGLIRRVTPGEKVLEWPRRQRLATAPNGKMNLGLGRLGSKGGGA